MITDRQTKCEGCQALAIHCNFDHVVEALEITDKIMCDDCYDGLLDDAAQDVERWLND